MLGSLRILKMANTGRWSVYPSRSRQKMSPYPSALPALLAATVLTAPAVLCAQTLPFTSPVGERTAGEPAIGLLQQWCLASAAITRNAPLHGTEVAVDSQVFQRMAELQAPLQTQLTIDSQSDTVSQLSQIEQLLCQPLREPSNGLSRGWLFLNVSRQEVENMLGGKTGTISVLDQVKVVGRGDRGGVSSDLVVAFAGPWRIAFGSTVSDVRESAEESDEEADALQEFFIAGGTGYVSGATPILRAGGETQDYHFSSFLMPRVGFLLPILGSASDAKGVNADIGIEARLALVRADQDLRIHLGGRYGRVFASQDWATTVGLPAPRSFVNWSDSFAFGHYVVGLQLGKNVLVSWTGPFDQPDVFQDKIKGQVSVQVIKSGA